MKRKFETKKVVKDDKDGMCEIIEIAVLGCWLMFLLTESEVGTLTDLNGLAIEIHLRSECMAIYLSEFQIL